MKTKLISLLILGLTFSYFNLNGQCVKCDTNSINTGEFATALGNHTIASGDASFAAGAYSSATGAASLTMGLWNLSEESYSTTIGSYCQTTANSSFVIGHGVSENTRLINPNSYSLIMGFGSKFPTFYVGTSPSSNKTGKIGIGNMIDPQAKLHIYSDDDESATLFLQPSNWTTEFNAQLWLGNKNHGISAEVEKGLVFDTENHFVFNNGYLGLGTDEPTALLDVNGSARIRSLTGNGERNIVVDSAGNLSATAFLGECTNCDQSTNNGTNSSALGLNNHASGFASFAVGAQSTTSGVSAISLGSFNTVEADYSTVIGSYLRANETASESVLIGSGANDKYILENNQTACLLVGFRSDKPTLFVGTSPEWHKTGKIGIGNMTNPQAKLHIYSDDDESATLFLQPSNWTTEFNAQLWLGNQNHGISAHVEKGLVFDTENHFVFNNGYLGLGTYEPTALLDVNGSARIRSLAGNGERNIVVDSAGNLSATAFSGQCIVCDNPPVGANANIIGINSTAQGVGSVAIGQGAHTLSTAGNSIAIGSQTKTVAGLSIVIGHGFSQDNMLTNYINRSLMVGFDSDVPTFFVGRSGGLGKTGKIGIGNITAPEAKLHIYSDDDESATLFLQPTIWGGDYNAQIWLGNQNHGISAELDEGLVFETENSFVFRNGDVYLEDIDKGIIMKSPDGRCWRGVLDNNGSLSFTVLETCPNGLDAIPEQGSLNNDNGLKVYPNPTNKYLTIELKENVTSPIIVRLLDEKGVELISKQTTNSSTQIFTGDLSPGVYFLSVTVDGKHLVEKVIKQ